MTEGLPVVSVVIPCRNEEKFIADCLDSLIAQDYPKDRIEVLVVDGMSEDGTRAIVKDYALKHPYIMLVDNPRKITPCAFNAGIKNSTGLLVMLMGAHATYRDDYISKCVKYSLQYNADNVGGILITLPRRDTFVGRAVVQALTNRFGVGGSVFRTGSKEPKWVDTVFGGCYKREVFEKIGLFNEELVSTQDMEFNLRLKRAGGRILLVPDIVCRYYTRSDLRSFLRNNFRNGLWAVLPFKFTEHMPVSLRHLVPLAFTLSLFGSALLSFFVPAFFWLFLLVSGSYLLTNVYFSSKIATLEKEPRYLLVMPAMFASLHVTYGLGSLLGLLKVAASMRFWRNRLSRRKDG